jgi:hypothetical protein
VVQDLQAVRSLKPVHAWCPPLTHTCATSGALLLQRAAQLQHLQPSQIQELWRIAQLISLQVGSPDVRCCHA